MILISIDDFPNVNGMTHTKTSYEIYSDSSGTNLVDSNYNDTVNLTRYKSSLVPVVGSVYYARTQRILNDGTILNWTPLVPVSLAYDSNSMLLNSTINIIQPIMTVDTVAIMDNQVTTFNVSLTPFASIGDNHYSTDWVIKGDTGVVIFSSINDMVNLESIIIDKTLIELGKNTFITIYANYNTASGISSQVVSNYMELATKNYTITSALTAVPSNVDYLLSLSKIDTSLHVNIERLELMDNVTSVYSIDLDKDTTQIIIPNTVLGYGKAYNLIIYYLEHDILRKDVQTLVTA